MNIYKKILAYALPFWRKLIIAFLLTIAFVFFNNVSLWVSVDFIRQLFLPDKTPIVQISAGNNVSQETQKNDSQNPLDNLLGVKKQLNLYSKINRQIKKLIIQPDRYDTLKIVCLVIFVTFLLKNISFYFRHVLLNFIHLRITTNMRNKMQAVLMRLPIRFFDKHHSAKLVSVMFNDITAIQAVFNDSFDKLFLIPIQIITNLVILILISWKLSLITMAIIPLSGILILKVGQSIRRKSRRVYEQISNVSAAFLETVNNVLIVKAFTSEKREKERFEKVNDKFFNSYFRSNKLKFATGPINETIAMFIISLLLWYGGKMVYSGNGLNAEDFIRFLIFLFSTFQPLKELSGLNNSLQTGFAAAERIFAIMETDQEVYEHPHAKKLITLARGIEINNVNFGYNPNDRLVLKNINLEIKKGETVAFVGPSGSGKTTLVKLLPRFYDLQQGEILIDGNNIKNISLQSLRQLIGIVTQDPILFNDFVRANIAYGTENVGDEQIIAAAEAANAWEFIQKMELGLDTIIGEKGVNLSGGQKQRLSIARALIKNPPILILDEATSALDTESEKLVQDAIETLMQNRTVLVIAHRLSTIIHADKIVVLHHGEIVDVGPHRRLLETCDLYRMLYEMQFRDETKESSNLN